ncbi:MAG: hypothetical protein JEZ05_02325 [Tenericutes bacterium]|nr:hypothetical protein [Mycoplasmatota bacterium]
MSEKRSLSVRLKDLGIEISNAAKKEYNHVVTSAEKQVKKDKLKHRFNLENPYRFVLLDSKIRVKLFDGFMSRHAKRYIEDDILVFYGSKEENSFEVNQQIKDLSDNTIYQVLEVVDVTLPVNYKDKTYDVECTAVYGTVL